MRLRRIALRTALVLGLGLSLTSAPMLACIGANCRSTASAEPRSKPLDLSRFMRQSAGNTTKRAVKKRHAVRRPAVKPQERPTTVPLPEPAPLPVEAVAAYASQPDPSVRVVARDELNEIDIIGKAATAATVTATPNVEHAVKLVEASEFNEIDRKADGLRPMAATARPARETLARGDPATDSWIEWTWAALRSAFTALWRLLG